MFIFGSGEVAAAAYDEVLNAVVVVFVAWDWLGTGHFQIWSLSSEWARLVVGVRYSVIRLV